MTKELLAIAVSKEFYSRPVGGKWDDGAGVRQEYLVLIATHTPGAHIIIGSAKFFA